MMSSPVMPGINFRRVWGRIGAGAQGVVGKGGWDARGYALFMATSHGRCGDCNVRRCRGGEAVRGAASRVWMASNCNLL